MFVVTVRFDVKAAHLGAFREATLAQARNSLERETGCHRFDVCFDPGDPARVFLYEIYTDADAFATHLESEHFKAFDATVRDWLEAKDVGTWERHEAD